MSLSPISKKKLAQVKAGKVQLRGTFRIDVAEIRAKQTAMSKEVADALFGKAKKPESPQKTERTKWKYAADKWFSEWIRLRDAGPDGRVKCVTCSHTDHWRYLQCGHYVTRGHQSTRFDEKNASCQCRGCNYNGGQHLKHAAAIDARYGAGTVADLEAKGARRCSRTTNDFKFIADTYRARVQWIKEHEPDKYATRKAA